MPRCKDIPATTKADWPALAAQSVSGFGATGFFLFVSSLMALNALGIDSMLPALPAIGEEFRVARINDRQWVIGMFMLGFGLAQIVWGPLIDRFGRKPLLIIGVVLFAVANLLAGLANTFSMLLVTRLLGGVSASATRIILISVVRDCYSGRKMARIMSLATMMIYFVPMLAPGVGLAITTLFGSWRAIFFALAVYAVVVGTLGLVRLKETLRPELRRRLNVATVWIAFSWVLRDRPTFGYTLASAFSFACVTGFIVSVEQIFTGIFKVQDLFPILFAGIGCCMALATMLNAWLVESLGARLISHGALIVFIAASAVHVAIAAAGCETLLAFLAIQGVQMFFYGLLSSNFSSIAMESVAEIAGSASSAQGFISTSIGAIVGTIIGQSFDGTTVPLTLGFLGCGLISLCAVCFAEQGRLFGRVMRL